MPEPVTRSEKDLVRGWTGPVTWGAPMIAIAATAFGEIAPPRWPTGAVDQP